MTRTRLGLIVALGLGVALGTLALAFATTGFIGGEEPPTVQAQESEDVAIWRNANRTTLVGDIVPFGFPTAEGFGVLNGEFELFLGSLVEALTECQVYFVPHAYDVGVWAQGTVWINGNEFPVDEGDVVIVCNGWVGIEYHDLLEYEPNPA